MYDYVSCRTGGTSVVGAAMTAQVFEEKKVDYWTLMNINYFTIVGLTDHFTADALNF